MKLVAHSSDIDWKVHELAWNLHEIEFALMWTHLTKGVCIHSSYIWGIGDDLQETSAIHTKEYNTSSKFDGFSSVHTVRGLEAEVFRGVTP